MAVGHPRVLFPSLVITDHPLQEHGFETESDYWEHPTTWKSSSNASLSEEDLFHELTYDITDFLDAIFIQLDMDMDKTVSFFEEDFNFTEIRSRPHGKCFVYNWNLEIFNYPITYIGFLR